MIPTTFITTPLRRIITTRSTLIAIILGPFLIFLLAAFAFENPELQQIPITTSIEEEGSFSRSFVATLESKNFRIRPSTDQNTCIESVQSGDTRACVRIDSSQHVTLFVDPTNTNIIAQIHNAFGDATDDYTTRAGLNYTTQLLEKLKDARAHVDASRPIITTFATQQEHVNRQLDEITGNLQTLTVDLDESLPSEVTKNLNQTNVLAMYRSVQDLRNSIDAQFRETTENVSRQLDQSAISEIDKQRIKQILADSKEGLRTTGDQFRISSELTQHDLEAFKTSTDSLVRNIQEANAQLERLDTLKAEARSNIRTLQTEMNTNLLQLILMQNALNRISSITDDTLAANPTGALGVYQPVPTRIEAVIHTKSPRLHSTYPALLALIILLAGSTLACTMALLESQSPATARNRMIPASKLSRYVGIFCATMIILIAQTSIILVLAALFVGIPSITALMGGIISILLIAALATIVGFAIAAATTSETAGILTCIVVTMSLFLISDSFVPIEALPTGLASATHYNPYFAATQMLKHTLLLGAPLSTEWASMLTLTGYCIILIGFSSRKTI
ncbi:ABC transporter permease [Candidatus Woesearchaeota archaeon]|nr:ABC transporter permease [Candidatus Woesearchaeota archaeon]